MSLLLPGSLGVLDNNLYDGLVAFWNFEQPDEEPGGGLYPDALPRDTALDWVEDLAANVGKGEGRPGEGVTLIEGVQSELELSYAKLSAPGNEDVLLKTQDWTIAFALFLAAHGAQSRVFTTNALQAAPGVTLSIRTGPVFNLKVQDAGAAPQSDMAQAPALGAWNHIILRHEHGVRTELVLNGEPAGDFLSTSSVTGTLDNGTWLWKLGSNTASVGGTFDSLGRWNRLLTDGNIATLYNAGRGLQYPFGDPTANVFS